MLSRAGVGRGGEGGEGGDGVVALGRGGIVCSVDPGEWRNDVSSYIMGCLMVVSSSL